MASKPAQQTAWMIWPAWRGEPRLLAHIAGLALESVGPGGELKIRFSVTSAREKTRHALRWFPPFRSQKTSIKADGETYSSTKDLLAALSDDGRRRFDSIEIEASSPRRTTRIAIWRRGNQSRMPEWLGAGVLLELEVGGSEPDINQWRDRLGAAIDRGAPRFSPAPLAGSGSSLDATEPSSIWGFSSNWNITYDYGFAVLAVPLWIVPQLLYASGLAALWQGLIYVLGALVVLIVLRQAFPRIALVPAGPREQVVKVIGLVGAAGANFALRAIFEQILG